MTEDELKQAVNGATDSLLRAILFATENEVIAKFQAAFAMARQRITDKHAAQVQLATTTSSAHRASPVLVEGSQSTPTSIAEVRESLRRRRARARALEAALRGSIVLCVREHPGSTVRELAPFFEVSPFLLRRRLQDLAENNVIRIERRRLARLRGNSALIYFVPERGESPEAGPTGPAQMRETA